MERSSRATVPSSWNTPPTNATTRDAVALAQLAASASTTHDDRRIIMIETFILLAAVFALPSAALLAWGEFVEWYFFGREKN
jgi:hypothetical protein